MELSKEHEKIVKTLILGYDLLHHNDFKANFYSTLNQTRLKHAKLEINFKLSRGHWDVVLLLCESYLKHSQTVVTDICTMSPLSESTTRRALQKLQELKIIERKIDSSDRRRQYIRLKRHYRHIVDQFVIKCAKDFKELIELNDKQQRIKVIDAWLSTETRIQLLINSIPALISYIDKKHRYLFNNKQYTQWFGFPENSLTGRHVRDVLGESAYQVLLPYIRKALSGNKQHFELAVPYLNNQKPRYISACFIPDLSDTGKINGFISHIVDITEQKQAQDALYSSKKKYSTLLNTIPIGIYETDKNGACLYVNPTWQKQAGMSFQEAIGEGWKKALYEEDRDYIYKMWTKHISDKQPWQMNYRFCTPEGKITHVFGTAMAIRNSENNITGYIGANLDISHKKHWPIPSPLTNRQQLDEILMKTDVGFWEWNIQTGEMFFNKCWAENFGYQLEELLPFNVETWLNLIHPDDRPRHTQLIESLFLQQRHCYEFETRMKHKNGDWVWVLEYGNVVISDDYGKPLRISGSHINISERKHHSELVAQATKKNEQILASIGEGIYGIDREGKIIFVNPAAEQLIGWTPKELIGQEQHKIIHHSKADGSIYPHQECPILASLSDGQTRRIDTEVFWRKDGSSFPVEYICTPIWEHCELSGAVVSFRDITEHKKALEKICFLANHDSLTSLPNRHLFIDSLKKALERARRYEHMVALLFIDLDGFKTINDNLGHDAGDLVLIEIAHRIQSNLRESDSVARIGGDEFVAILDQINDPQIPSRIAGKLLSSIKQNMTIEGLNINMTASIGISLYPLHALSSIDLLKIADQAMYLAKKSSKGIHHFGATFSN